MRPHRLTAAWVVPVSARPVRGGAILIDELGRIADVGADGAVPHPPGCTTQDFPGSAILPGLVNTHTHLELTGLTAHVEPSDFPAWIRDLRAQKAARTREDFLAAANQGLADCYAAGVTSVADTGDTGVVIEALAQRGGSGIAYHEVFGPDPAQREESLAGLKTRVAELRSFEGERVRLGVSPHAPYSVSGPLYQATAEWARMERLPLAVHVAESAAESALLASGTGPFADMWTRRGIPPVAPTGQTPIGWLERHGVLGPDTLCIHVVRASRADLQRLATADCPIAHCPLSNVMHQHGDAPLRDFLAAGLRVGVGTDSVLSVGRLDLLAEARAACALADLGAAAGLELCTLGAARALGLGGEIGSLEAGKWADATVIRIGSPSEPIAAILASRPEDVVATFLGGRPVYPAGKAA
jgi:cytosine/adenosine deaminase-related metal-dependent hydrolase